MTPIFSDRHLVGGGYSIQFSYRPEDAKSLQCVWSPRLPSPRDFRRKVDRRKYEAAREVFFQAIGQNTGKPVLVLEG